ncbi:MAG TPA: hypothetical protein VHE55_09910 [Fimbriimonadaceae bacterium]|nr:hypothetical protein [Fimbriimonadaceae bacterium]
MKSLNCLVIGAFLALASFAMSDQRYFIQTYDWNTPAQFEREIELTYDQFQGGAGFGQIEFEYGLTDRWMVAPYLLLEREGGKTKVAGFQLEQRYRFGDFHYGRVLPAVYFEVHKENHESYELEGKLIGSYLPNEKWIASGNFIVEQHIEKGAKTEIGYAAGLSRTYASYNVGIETKGNFLENEHIVGPTVGFIVGDRAKISVGAFYSFGKGDASVVRVLFEKEF